MPSDTVFNTRRRRLRPALWPYWARGGVLVFAFLALVGCSRPSGPLPTAPAPTPTVTPPISFPRDAGAHDVLTEWWYYTGHLQSADGARRYGFEFTIFQVLRQGTPAAYLGHFAVSDITSGTFSHQARFSTGEFHPDLNLDVQGWTLTTEGSADVIHAAMSPGPGAEPPFALSLRLQDRKPPALHHGGYIGYGDPGGSYYYSRTRIEVSGTVNQLGAAPTPVTGQAWMDHQWGNFVVSSTGGWDWYSLQLEDNTELMLYVLRAGSGQTTGVYGSQVLADGTVRDLEPGAVQAVASGEWTSPHTGAKYPSGWRIDAPAQNLHFTITPQLLDQELYFPGQDAGGLSYWEGAVDVRGESGSPNGVGYVELTGYAP